MSRINIQRKSMTEDQIEILHRVFAMNEQIVKQNYTLMMVLTNPTIRKSNGWQDLTETEVETIDSHAPSKYSAVLMTQASLREKNNG